MKPWTVQEIADKADNDGLGYLVCDGLTSDRIADPELARLWRAAADAMTAVEAYLDAHSAAIADEASDLLAGPVTVSHTQLCIDDYPDCFAGAKVNEYDQQVISFAGGGEVKLGHNPDEPGPSFIWISGRFSETAELLDLVARFSGQVIFTGSRCQLLTLDTEKAREYVRFQDGQAFLAGRSLRPRAGF